MSENTNERLDRYAEAIRNGLYDSCPNCGGNGWTVENQTWGQPEGEQVQCERCGYLNAGLNPRPGGEGLAASFIARVVMAVADAEHADLLAQIERVRALHRASNDGSFCVGCWEAGGYDGAPSYPCSTIIALDGEK